MVLSIDEVLSLRDAAKKSKEENDILEQWYGCYKISLMQQKESGAKELDFSERYIIGYTPEQILKVIGDQLTELGVMPRVGYIGSMPRVYFLKPGQRIG